MSGAWPIRNVNKIKDYHGFHEFGHDSVDGLEAMSTNATSIWASGSTEEGDRIAPASQCRGSPIDFGRESESWKFQHGDHSAHGRHGGHGMAMALDHVGRANPVSNRECAILTSNTPSDEVSHVSESTSDNWEEGGTLMRLIILSFLTQVWQLVELI